MRESLRLTLAATALLACTSCRGCTARADDRDAGAAASARFDVEPLRVRAHVPAMAWAAVTRDGEESGAAGLADVENGERASAATLFEAASIAKLVIATCVMQLVEDKELALDTDVSAYLGFTVRHPHAAEPITLRHLLSHTASVVDLPESRSDGRVALGDFLGRYFETRHEGVFLDAGPGTTMAYSNVGASLAALVVERATHTPFADRAKAKVFAPLGMHATSFRQPSAPLKIAAPYRSSGEGFVRLPLPSHALYPVVDLFSSAADLARFARAILSGGALDGARILRPPSIDEMVRVQLPDAAPADALGWQVRTFGRSRAVGHEGEDEGASTGLYIDRAKGTGAVVLANGDAFQSDDPDRTKAIAEVIERLLSR